MQLAKNIDILIVFLLKKRNSKIQYCKIILFEHISSCHVERIRGPHKIAFLWGIRKQLQLSLLNKETINTMLCFTLINAHSRRFLLVQNKNITLLKYILCLSPRTITGPFVRIKGGFSNFACAKKYCLTTSLKYI